MAKDTLMGVGESNISSLLEEKILISELQNKQILPFPGTARLYSCNMTQARSCHFSRNQKYFTPSRHRTTFRHWTFWSYFSERNDVRILRREFPEACTQSQKFSDRSCSKRWNSYFMHHKLFLLFLSQLNEMNILLSSQLEKHWADFYQI